MKLPGLTKPSLKDLAISQQLEYFKHYKENNDIRNQILESFKNFNFPITKPTPKDPVKNQVTFPSQYVIQKSKVHTVLRHGDLAFIGGKNQNMEVVDWRTMTMVRTLNTDGCVPRCAIVVGNYLFVGCDM